MALLGRAESFACERIPNQVASASLPGFAEMRVATSTVTYKSSLCLKSVQ